MSILYDKPHLLKAGPAREFQSSAGVTSLLNKHFRITTLRYLEEPVLNHVTDSLMLDKEQLHHSYNDYSFLTAPAYKAFEGFLFQLAKDLKLPSSGKPELVGTYYFDEQKVDGAIDALLDELEKAGTGSTALSSAEKDNIKDNVKEMKRFLRNYRHTPAHFHGEPMISREKSLQNILSMYRIIDETVAVLQNAKLIPTSTS